MYAVSIYDIRCDIGILNVFWIGLLNIKWKYSFITFIEVLLKLDLNITYWFKKISLLLFKRWLEAEKYYLDYNGGLKSCVKLKAPGTKEI